ncbi:ec966eca-d234-4fc7-8246-8541cd6cc60f [Thermothielavioides terrestris]|uniref:Zn(2)-C6 fungal-type domain-containing protein n=2 Tax=Thermothielavioides terrestris TaxID=2587410 RepID=G2QXR9_THETT|nr:uncharacterized protein THITE_2108095 [Thermothielavioides terrestris NRRL 8126]AEO63187.1 hypothetical protein THITE_2108095 [Thermothielavioides terrestris NRRL 8126]SPQ21322.1 ec966eca-d234-4fc7-8246-8541cd6cc60f [Thermothielavioides terrestris]
MTTAVKRACDACHRRKVKCDGINPCRNCSASQLACTYNAIPQKKGPKGSRAKVINELKETQRQTSLSAKLQGGMAGGAASASLAPTPRLLTEETLHACIEFFFAHMYPMMPILDRQRLEQDARCMEQNLDTYCLLTSLCAFVCLQPGMVIPGMGMPMNDPFNPDMMLGGNIVTSTLLMEETMRVRKGYDFVASPTVNTLCTSFFLFAVHHGLEMHDKAWFYLREATTLAHLTRMNQEQTYMQYDGSDNIDASRRRRLYWLLFVTERAYALQHRRPLTLQASINPPSPNEHPADLFLHHGTGFLRMIGLFRGFDEMHVPLWMKTRGECSDSYLAALDKQLQEVLPAYLNDTQAQLSELSINQQWLKHKAWELSVANGHGNNAGVPYVDTINDLLPMVSHFPGNLGLHGLSLFEHLLNVTCSLTDMLAMLPAPRTPFTPGPHDQLRKILNIVSVIRNGEHRFLPLLLSRVASALSKLASPMLQNAPENAPACNLDIFDGFGNAGMGQPSMYASGDYDSKFGVPRLEELSSDSSSPNAPPSSNSDMNSPFTNSSGVMSPGMELPHPLQTDFTSMPEMVMSPMSHAPPPSLRTPGGMNSQQARHPQQHSPMSPFPNSNAQIQGLNGNNINPPPNISLASQMHLGQGIGGGINANLSQANNMMARAPPPQRANSYAMGVPIRTVGDFQALQRANSDMNSMGSMGMSALGPELDFNTLPR